MGSTPLPRPAASKGTGRREGTGSRDLAPWPWDLGWGGCQPGSEGQHLDWGVVSLEPELPAVLQPDRTPAEEAL